MDITQAFEGSGAELTTTNTLRHALLLVELDGLSAAILDHALGDGDSKWKAPAMARRLLANQRLIRRSVRRLKT
jgi:hypothetical protein